MAGRVVLLVLLMVMAHQRCFGQKLCDNTSDLVVGPLSSKDGCIDLSRSAIEQLNTYNLKKYEVVRLSYNPIKDISNVLSNSLRYLDISYTSLTELPQDFCKFTNLERIDAYDMAISFPNCFCTPGIKVINGNLIPTRPGQNWEECVSLRNGHFWLPDDTLSARRVLLEISKIKTLERIGLYNLSANIPLKSDQLLNLTTLEISIKTGSQLEMVFDMVSQRHFLKTLCVIVPKGMKIPATISKLNNMETLAIHTEGGGLVTLPKEVESIKVKRLYLSKNMKELKIDKNICILYRGTPDISHFERSGYHLEWFQDPIDLDSSVRRK